MSGRVPPLPRSFLEPTCSPYACAGGCSDMAPRLRELTSLVTPKVTRRRFIQLAGGLATALALIACGQTPRQLSQGGVSPEATIATASASGKGLVFNTGSKNVTRFDPAANQVTGTSPVDAVVRWLSNEQHYWDGKYVWTYDFPQEEVQVLAIDPYTLEVVRRVPIGGKAPGHSFVLTPDNKKGFVNSAGSNFVAVVDPVASKVVDRFDTGAFP